MFLIKTVTFFCIQFASRTVRFSIQLPHLTLLKRDSECFESGCKKDRTATITTTAWEQLAAEATGGVEENRIRSCGLDTLRALSSAAHAQIE